MTNGQNNPNNLPDEDWAMSEPEIPVKKEFQAKAIDEQAAKLYAPPETGDLAEWDIDVEESFNTPEEPAPSPTSPPQAFTEPTAFTPPQQTFEILKPLAPPKFKGEGWEMNKANAKNDGWKMPDPTFRATEGEILTKVRRSPLKSAVSSESAQAQENLPDIYAPPDTEESIKPITGDFDLQNNPQDFSEEINFSNEAPAQNNISPQMPVQTANPTKNKKGTFVIWGILLGSLFIIILLAVGAGLYFYSTKL